MSLVCPITRRDIDIKRPALYGPIRDDHRRRVIALKRARRVMIGRDENPNASRGPRPRVRRSRLTMRECSQR